MEDELHLRQNIKKFLSIKGYEVDDFENGEKLLKHSNPVDYDCMILDINTPEVDGFEVLEYIRSSKIMTPVLFISALTDVQKVLKAFELGAGDYLKKPFDFAELEARMLRISSVNRQNNILHINNIFSYSIKERILFNNGFACQLGPIQKKVLYLLVKNKNNLVTFDMLIDYVWQNKDISHGTILSTMRNLKNIFKDDTIKNVKGEGYVFEI